jgi:hypothetical protein
MHAKGFINYIQIHVYSSWRISEKATQHMGYIHICCHLAWSRMVFVASIMFSLLITFLYLFCMLFIWQLIGHRKLLSWAWLTCLFFIPEMVVKSAANTLQVIFLRAGYWYNTVKQFETYLQPKCWGIVCKKRHYTPSKDLMLKILLVTVLNCGYNHLFKTQDTHGWFH